MTTTGTSVAFQRFAAAHLGDRTERAVYIAIAAGSGAEWTTGQTGAQAGVSHREADQVLRRFAAAGFVERLDIPGRPHRYRWAPSMACLTATAAAAVDPVIDPSAACPSLPTPPTLRPTAHRTCAFAPSTASCGGAPPIAPGDAPPIRSIHAWQPVPWLREGHRRDLVRR